MTTQIKAGVIAANAITASELASSALSGGSFTGDVTFDTDTLVVDSTNNRVGIGTSNPSYPLSVTGISSATTEFRLNNSFSRVADIDGAGAFAGGYNLYLDGSAVPRHDSGGALSGYYYSSDGSVRFYAVTSQSADQAAEERLRIDPYGTINIATTGGTWGGFTGKIENYLSSWANWGTSGTLIAHNARYDGSNYITLSTGYSSRIWMNGSGEIHFDTTGGSNPATNSLTFNNMAKFVPANASTGLLKFGNGNVLPPNTSDHTQGTRISFYDANSTSWYAMGIESNTLWFNSDEHYKWYRDGSEVMELTGGSGLDVKNGLGTGPITSCSGFTGTAGNSYLIKPPGAMEPFWAVYSGDNYKGRGKGYFRWWYGYGDAATGDNQNKVEVDLVDLDYQFYEVIVEDMANTTYMNSAPAWEYAYWSSLQKFNTQNMSSNYASSSSISGNVVYMWGYAGGHGLYNSTIGNACSWGGIDSNSSIGAGYDGSCGTYGNTSSTTSPHTTQTAHTLRLGRPQQSSAFYTESTGAFSYWFNF